jgi:ComF family protein
MGASGLITRTADAVFPYIQKCVCCGAEKGVSENLCARCASGLEALKAGESRIADFKAFSLYKYDGPVKSLVTGYKYGDKKWLGRFIGEELAGCISSLPYKIDCVCNVPLHEKRKRARGFDQSEEIARRISEAAGLPYIAALRRVRNTKTQTKLNEAQRAENIKGAFESAAAAAGSVLLIDDVLTTGATAGECARVLIEAGAENVYVMTFARAVMRGKDGKKGRVRRLVDRFIRG